MIYNIDILGVEGEFAISTFENNRNLVTLTPRNLACLIDSKTSVVENYLYGDKWTRRNSRSTVSKTTREVFCAASEECRYCKDTA